MRMRKYVVNEDLIETFKNSLKLNKKYAKEKIDMIERLGPDYLKERNAKEIERHKKAIKQIDMLLEEIDKETEKQTKGEYPTLELKNTKYYIENKK